MPSASAPAPFPTGEQFELSFEDQRAVVVEVGGGLRRYAVGDWEVLDGYGSDERVSGGRGQVLIPWPNRLRDGRYEHDGTTQQLALTEPAGGNAIHGLVRWASWQAVEQAPDRVVMAHRLHPQQGWPFTLDLRIAYALDAHGLSVQTTATNLSAEACPYGAGAHPYLSVGTALVDEAVLQAPGEIRLLADDRGIPTGEALVAGTPYDFRAPRPIGELVLDTAYGALARDDDGRARVHLSAPDGGRHVALWMDEAYTWLMLFTGDTLADGARRRSLAAEPMTCAPNALQSGAGLRTLAPGESCTASWGVAASTRAA